MKTLWFSAQSVGGGGRCGLPRSGDKVESQILGSCKAESERESG